MRKISLVFAFAICSAWSAEAAALQSHLDVSVTPGTWSYTLSNDEPVGSSNYLDSFSLTINGPVNFIGSPQGWGFTSDYSTNITWSSTGSAPYPFDIAPGTSLGGFTLQSAVVSSGTLPVEIDSWDHTLDDYGPVLQTSALTLAVPTVAAPEPAVLGPVAFALAGLLLSRSRAALRK